MTPTYRRPRYLRVLVRYLIQPGLFGLGIRIGIRLILSKVLEYSNTFGDQQQELLTSSRPCRACQLLGSFPILRTYLIGFREWFLRSYHSLSRALSRRVPPRIGKSSRGGRPTPTENLNGGGKSVRVSEARQCRSRQRSRALRQSLERRLKLIQSGHLDPSGLRSRELILALRYQRSREPRSSQGRRGCLEPRLLLHLNNRRVLGRRHTLRHGRRSG